MAAPGGNPHLEGIISDFEGLDSFFLMLLLIKLLAVCENVSDVPLLCAFYLKVCNVLQLRFFD